MSTSSDAQPRSAHDRLGVRRARPATTSDTASGRTAGASAPIASATRYATSAESMPPDSPRTARSNPAWRSWPRMNRRDDSPGDVGVDGELGGQVDQTARPSSRPGSIGAVGPGATPARLESSARPARSGDDPRRVSRSWSSGRSSRSSGRAIRSRRMSASAMSTQNSPSSYNGALKIGAPVGAMTSEPPQNEIDSSTPTRLQNTTNDVVSWAYVRISRPPRGRRPEPHLVRGGQVASRRRRHVDQDLGAVEGEQLGHRQVPEVLAHGEPDADAEPRRHGPQHDRRPRRTAARRTARRSAGRACDGRGGSRRPRGARRR